MSIQSNTPDDPDGITELEGWLADQGALSGVLQTLYELQLSLLSVEVLADKPEED